MKKQLLKILSLCLLFLFQGCTAENKPFDESKALRIDIYSHLFATQVRITDEHKDILDFFNIDKSTLNLKSSFGFCKLNTIKMSKQAYDKFLDLHNHKLCSITSKSKKTNFKLL